MKKVKIELKDNRDRHFYLFDSAESLYVWLADNVTLCTFMKKNSECVTTVSLDANGQFLEVEWMGAEYTRDGTFHNVRIAKATPTPYESSGGYRIIKYFGWIHNDYLKFNNAEDDDIIVSRIDDTGQIDIDKIFNTTVYNV